MPWNEDGSRKNPALYKKSGFKMKGWSAFTKIEGGNLTDKQVWEMNKDDVQGKYGAFEEYQLEAEKWRQENKRE